MQAPEIVNSSAWASLASLTSVVLLASLVAAGNQIPVTRFEMLERTTNSSRLGRRPAEQAVRPNETTLTFIPLVLSSTKKVAGPALAEQCIAHLLWTMLYRMNEATNIAEEA